MQSFFDTIRENCDKNLWSKAVELSRRDAVMGDQASGSEVRLRVLDRSKGFSNQVDLFIEDEDWTCSCSSDDDPCLHVAAAVISLKRARDQGVELPVKKSGQGKVFYCFTQKPEGVHFERVIREEGMTDTLIVKTLSSLTDSKSSLVPTDLDMTIDVLLGYERSGIFSAKKLEKIFKKLSESDCVEFRGENISVNSKPIGLCLVIESQGPCVKAYGVQDERVTEVVSNAVVLCGKYLHPLSHVDLNDEERELIQSGRIFNHKTIPYLLSELVPKLEKKIKVVNRLDGVGEQVRSKPRLELKLESKEYDLLVTPRLVYGDPEIAFLKNGSLNVVGSQIPIRNENAEYRLVDELGKVFSMELDRRYRFSGGEGVEFVQKLRSWKGDVTGRGYEDFSLEDSLVPNLSVGPDANAELGFHCDGNPAKTASVSGVWQAWQREEALVPLIGGGWAPIPQDWLEKHQAQLELLFGDKKSDFGATAPIPSYAVAELLEDISHEVDKGSYELDRDFKMLPHPKDLKATLREYQLYGFSWLQSLKATGFGGLLSDEMGLGKTIQTIAGMTCNTLVVVPASLLTNWKTEINKFRPDLKVQVYHGGSRSLDTATDVIITSYHTLRIDFDDLGTRDWQMVILDEAHYIKNPTSRVSQVIYRLKASQKVALTGTPVENRYEDLWAIFRFLNPGLLGGLSSFRKVFKNGQNAELLARRVGPFMLRRLKKDVAKELPKKTEMTVKVDFSDYEREVYESLYALTQSRLKEHFEKNGTIIQALELIMRLRQACCHLELLPTHKGGDAVQSAKLCFLVDNLEELSSAGHKVLVFSQWTSYLDLIGKALAEEDIDYLRIDGKTRDRGHVVDTFQNDNTAQILLMSLKAGGVGLNLTAADHVFIMDPWWNPAVEQQAADRAHRIGQSRRVFIHKLIVSNSIEERIVELQERKKQLAESILSNEGGEMGVTKDDLMGLLQ